MGKTSKKPIVSLKDVSLTYLSGIEGLSKVDLDVFEGESLAVLGPKGSGKSTLLRLLSGDLKPTSGEIHAENAGDNEEKGFSFIAALQPSYALFPEKSLFENLALPLRVSKLSKEEVTERVKEVASLLGLEGFLKKKPRDLSGAERQRASLAKALIKKPKILLVDDPLEHLDPKLRPAFRLELRALQKKLGFAMVYATSEASLALRMGERVAYLKLGKLLQVGTPEDLYSHPDDVAVARGIGYPEMNLLPASFEEGRLAFEDGPSLELSKEDTEMLRAHFKEKAGDFSLLFGIRPTDVRLVEDGGIPLKVSFIEKLLKRNYLHADFGKGELTLTAPERENPFLVGEEIHVAFDFSKATYFDGDKAIH